MGILNRQGLKVVHVNELDSAVKMLASNPNWKPVLYLDLSDQGLLEEYLDQKLNLQERCKNVHGFIGQDSTMSGRLLQSYGLIPHVIDFEISPKQAHDNP